MILGVMPYLSKICVALSNVAISLMFKQKLNLMLVCRTAGSLALNHTNCNSQYCVFRTVPKTSHYTTWYIAYLSKRSGQCHKPLSDQFQYMTEHSPIWYDKFTVHYQWGSRWQCAIVLLFLNGWPTLPLLWLLQSSTNSQTFVVQFLEFSGTSITLNC